MKILILSCSLNPDSRSARMAELAGQFLTKMEVEIDHMDLRDHTLPHADGDDAHRHPAVGPIYDRVHTADGILMAVPIYNYDINAAGKNLIELTSKAWTQKTVGFLCAAGSQVSYMAVMPLANSLMLDFRCLVLPSFVYVTAEDEAAETGFTEPIQKRIQLLCEELVRLARYRSTAGR